MPIEATPAELESMKERHLAQIEHTKVIMLEGMPTKVTDFRVNRSLLVQMIAEAFARGAAEENRVQLQHR